LSFPIRPRPYQPGLFLLERENSDQAPPMSTSRMRRDKSEAEHRTPRDRSTVQLAAITTVGNHENCGTLGFFHETAFLSASFHLIPTGKFWGGSEG